MSLNKTNIPPTPTPLPTPPPNNWSSLNLDQIMDKTQQMGSKALDSDELNIPIGDAFDKFSFMASDLSNIIQNLPDVLCSEGTDCHKKKTENNLREKYYLAKELALTAPEDLRQAKKNYFVFLEGTQGWTKMEREKYHKKAIMEKTLIDKTHKDKIKQLHTDIKLYGNTLGYHKQLEISVQDHASKYNKTSKQATTIKNNNALNERKITYETEQNTTMIMWKNILRTIYIVIILMYTYFFIRKQLWKPGGYRNYRVDIALLLFFYIWPFIALPITKLLFTIIHFIIGFVPIDTYAHLNYSS